MDNARKKKIQADMFERSYLEWNLMRSLAFGERDWILICAVMFLISDTRDFLTWSGFICMWLGIFFLGPTYGFFIHLVSKRIYFYGKARGVMPKTVAAAKKITWQATAVVFPFALFLSWHAVNLYYESLVSMSSWSTTPAIMQQQQQPHQQQKQMIAPLAPVTR